EQRTKEILLEAKEEALTTKTAAESEIRARRQESQNQQRRLDQREENLDRRNIGLDRQTTKLQQRESSLENEKKSLSQLRQEEMARLEEVSSLSMLDARELLLKRAEEDLEFEMARKLRDAENEAHLTAEDNAREIVGAAIQRLASGVVSEATVSSVALPSDDMKGRLIGREGRNIRAIEAATGADLIIDDTPEAVTISCFDPIRREVARRALEQMIKDGRIHPARVEETVARVRAEVNDIVRKAGENALLKANIRGLHPELTKLMGRLKFRTSYGENVLRHCVEVSLLAAMMASELGARVNVCRTAGFLHDVGKAVSHEVEGPHAEIGAEIVAKYGVSQRIQLAIQEHHDRQMTSTESFIVAAADALSAARPGARRDTVENYIARLEALEETARGFEGVERCFAIQAGREIRVMVSPEKIDDAKAAVLARDVVKRIEETLNYPGQIKVVVIRESRSVEFAK
ncbi:MAG: ribonuclease Y, partial [Planctomycetota bacterium]|nr:ribonuclease Y [Planctomycetota bacterium]